MSAARGGNVLGVKENLDLGRRVWILEGSESILDERGGTGASV
jgi:hypothetical protein